MTRVLEQPAKCALCGRGPYTSQNGLRSHALRIHPQLSVRDRKLLIDRSIREAQQHG